MPEPSDRPQSPPNTLQAQKIDNRHVGLAAWMIVLALVLAVWLLRFYRLSELPPGIQSDEGADGFYALQVLQGDHALFFPEKASGREAIGVYAIALSTALLGRTLLAFHLPTALASAGTVFLVFWLGRLLFGQDIETGRSVPWRGLLIGGVGAGLMAVSVSQVFLSRAALRANFLPLLLTLSLAFLWMGWRHRNWKMVALAGLWTGLLPYTYLAARFTPFLFLFLGLSFLNPLGPVSKDNWRAERPLLSLFLGTAGLVAAPILIHFALNPDHFSIRSGQLWVFGEEQGSIVSVILGNVWEYLLAFGFQGDLITRYNFAGRPLLNLWQALFFWIGVAAAVWRWRNPALRLLLLWLCVMTFPGMLAETRGMGPNFLRMSGAAPAVFLLVGVGIWEAIQCIAPRLAAIQTRARFNLPVDRTPSVAAVGVLIAAAVLLQGVDSYRSFFSKWAGTPAFFRAYHTEWTDAARFLNEQPYENGVIYILPYPSLNEHYADEHFGFEYLYQGDLPAHIIHATTPHNLAQKIESALSLEENLSTVKYLDWDNEVVGGDARADAHAIALLDKYGMFQGSEEVDDFLIHTFSDLSLDQPWRFYENIQPLEIHFDGGISLYGFNHGRGVDPPSSHQELTMEEPHPLWVALLWQTAPGLEIEYSISLRLHNSAGDRVHLQDFVLRNRITNTTRDWTPEEPVDTFHYLDLPSDLPPGQYELRLVVYDFESLKPTVELGVWEPETTISPLQIGEPN